MININEAVKEIREILERKREELSLTFTEEDHKYMMVDTNGEVVDTGPCTTNLRNHCFTIWSRGTAE